MAGDVHGEHGWIKVLIHEALAKDCTLIMQIGDFGYWEHMPMGRGFLAGTERWLAENGLTLWWIDGNHENHEMLRATYGPRDDGLWEIRPHILYVPRGHRWEWDGVKCLGLGGAWSIDKAMRTEGISWWPEEVISIAEMYRACEGGVADVMFTHDCPTGVNPLPPNPLGIFPESYANRQMLRTVVDTAQPKRLYHGHYHHRHTTVLNGDNYSTLIEGLSNDGTYEDSWIVFDTEAMA